MASKIYRPKPLFSKEEFIEVEKVIKGSTLSTYDAVSRVSLFQERFAKHCRANYAIATNSGTAALHTSLVALGIGPGDEVLIPTYTFVATASAVKLSGAKPVFVDIAPNSYTIDPKEAEKKITKRTKAIIPVHLFGIPADMAGILALARKYNLKVIEDACQANGSTLNKRYLGTIGDAGCFSFQQTKNLTCGEGGAILCNSKRIAEKARLIRQHGKLSWSVHKCLGYNYRMTEIQAAIALVQLKKLNKMNLQRRKNAAIYKKMLSGLPLTFPCFPKESNVVYNKLPLLLPKNLKHLRKKLMRKLKQGGMHIERGYSCLLNTLPFLKNSGKKENYPIAEDILKRIILLSPAPCFSEKDTEQMCRIFKCAWADVIK